VGLFAHREACRTRRRYQGTGARAAKLGEGEVPDGKGRDSVVVSGRDGARGIVGEEVPKPERRNDTSGREGHKTA